jgi:hypothetical protein
VASGSPEFELSCSIHNEPIGTEFNWRESVVMGESERKADSIP